MDKFYQLTVIKTHKKNGFLFADFQCDCGAIVTKRYSAVKRGDIKSCGCLKKKRARLWGERNKVHGCASNGKPTRTYRSWESMLARCNNQNDQAFKNYGGRGITVCDRWLKFENFLEDMGERPANTSIDRIENNGNYEPGNCRWEKPKAQSRNKRSSRIITLNNAPILLIEACEIHQKSYQLMYDRIYRQSRTVERAFA